MVCDEEKWVNVKFSGGRTKHLTSKEWTVEALGESEIRGGNALSLVTRRESLFVATYLHSHRTSPQGRLLCPSAGVLIFVCCRDVSAWMAIIVNRVSLTITSIQTIPIFIHYSPLHLLLIAGNRIVLRPPTHNPID